MKTIHKILVGFLVALAVAIPLGIAANATPRAADSSITRIAADPTNTPRPPGGPCQSMDC